MKDADAEQLRDNPAGIASYLSKAFETDDVPTILSALSDALRAQNVSALARATGLRRDRLYKTFGGQIDPGLTRMLKLLEGLGVQLTVKERAEIKSKPPLPKLGRPRKAGSEELP
jgi:probable addiction module antidote protein